MIQERLPVSAVDITGRIYPQEAHAWLESVSVERRFLMNHLLLRTRRVICRGRSLRLLHLNDIALLAARMTADDWNVLWDEHAADSPWWALPPLRLLGRYYPSAIPDVVLARLERDCPPLLRTISHHQTLTQVSCSDLWLHALAGIEWSRSVREVMRYVRNRVRPPGETIKERADMVRTQFWLQGQSWVGQNQGRRILTLLTRPVPRMDTLYVVRAALESPGLR